MTNKHLEDARAWLEHARDEKDNHRVACAMAVHSVIKSLTALFEEFLGEMPGRHDHATDYFRRLIDDGHIDPDESKYTRNIQNMLQKKTDADYKATYFSKSDADKWRKQSERIYKMAKNYVE
ncbi:MAG: HEPN domain-containing protein [Candidatus Nanohaloarchaea archaeon]|nr:HEPN domain-containing protein [Candidatus Nanohaloarchaea archaeon]